MISGQTVLITGGAGYVGRTLLEHMLDRDAAVVRVFDNSEVSLSELNRSIDDDRVRYFMGDVRDVDRLYRAMEDVDIVLHTAAMKHVDVSEYNPFEAVKTNVVGLQNVVDAAIDASVETLLFTSSDKAVNPANTMGTTKLLGEKLVIAGNKYSGRPELSLACVRFGNVVDSSQSVIRVFTRQIKEGGPVTLTDPRMTRFFLTRDDLLALVSGAIEDSVGGEIFIRKMPAVRIEDLASAMVDVLAPRYGHDPDDIDIEVTGRRMGETFEEFLMSEREASRTVEDESTYAILPERGEGAYIEHAGLVGYDKAADITRSSQEADTLGEAEIIEFLERDAVTGVTR